MANVKNNASAKETKRRLIEAAGEVFAQHGFERATIKEITDRAGASVAAVNYHFSDKQELYDQVVQYVHSECDARYGTSCELVADVPPAQQLREFVGRLLRQVLDPTLPPWFRQIKSREMQSPSGATERFIEGTIRPFTRQLEGLVLNLIGRQLPQAELTRMVNSVIGQCVYYAYNQELLVRLYPEQPPASAAVEAIADHITRFSLAALSCWK